VKERKDYELEKELLQGVKKSKKAKISIREQMKFNENIEN